MAKNQVSDVVGDLDQEITRLLASHLFWEFCLFYDEDFFTRRPFLQQIASAFQEIHDNYVEGRALTAAVSLPPRGGKSYITSLFCCWWLGKFPDKSVMRNTCTARLYEKFSYDCRAIIRSKKYQQVFPTVKLAGDKQNLQGWNLETSKQVGYFGAGVGGTIIGFGANIAISDDLYPGLEQALSANYRENTHTWKQGTHDSRKEKNCPEIFIGTRWTKTDEIGLALESGQIDIEVKIPALVNGKTFCDDVKSTEEYLKVKDNTDDLIWNAEYMQEPDEAKGLLFAKSSLKFYDPAKVDISQPEFKFLFTDPADEGADSLAAPAGHLVGRAIFIPHVIFNTDGTDLTIPAIVDLLTSGKYHACNIEGNGGWMQFGKTVRNEVQKQYEDCQIRIVKNSTNKDTRILAAAAFIRNHCYFRSDYEDFPEYRAFMKELMGYLKEGGNKHDDAPDAMAGLASYFQVNFSHIW